jgi:hypothetical protein
VVQVTSVVGTRVAFTVVNAQLVPLAGAGNVGSGTLTLAIDAHADCFMSAP